MNLFAEKWYPIAAAATVAAVWWHFSPSFPRDEKEFLSAAISIGSIFTGFIATAKAILAALPGDSVMRKLRSSGYIKNAVSYLTEGLYACLLLSVYSVAGFFLLKIESPSLEAWYTSIWIFFAVYAFLSFHRIASILSRILQYDPGDA